MLNPECCPLYNTHVILSSIGWLSLEEVEKKKIDVYTDRMNEVEKCTFYFVSWEVLYLSCTAGKILSVRCNTCLMEIMDCFLIMIINAALNLTDAY